MDPVKVIIFVAAFLLLLVLGRKLSAMGESSITPVAPLPELAVVEPTVIAAPRPKRKEPAVVGAELPFPIHVPPINRDEDGRYNRPEFLNYYFEERDLVRGPENPGSFYDDFMCWCATLKTVIPRCTNILLRHRQDCKKQWTMNTCQLFISKSRR
jgi:hypothetical protein